MICIPVSAETNDGMLRLLGRAAAEPAQLHELRLDALREEPLVERLVAASTRPVVVTCRSRAEGGGFAGPAGERRAILRRAVTAGAAYIDAEVADLASLGDTGSTIRILSFHDFEKTPPDLSERVRAMAANPHADWVKFAVMARTPADNLHVFAALAASPKPAVGIAMGDLGMVSRVLGPRFGSRITFGSLDSGLESATGQPTARELAEVYRLGSITAKTQVYGVRPGAGQGGASHLDCNAAFGRLNMDAVCLPLLAGDEATLSSLLAVLAAVSGGAECSQAIRQSPRAAG